MRPGDLVSVEKKYFAIVIDHPKKVQLVGHLIPVLKPDGSIEMVYPEAVTIISKGSLWPEEK